ncbi:alpha/beta fold hydrolase [Thioalkalivibrio sp. ALJ24]|uniref:alpha/beta fold hydrolase n=1 Tax=Thioalkalivibrio sp. ALJ24 TaxID=545276 RepID=UPI000476CC50|nr:alpha/beta fold hydrolase [Thioalkalivibrio sp. ALJ24]
MSGCGHRGVVLLHGWGFSGADWDPVIRALRARGFSGPVHAPDLPGHGQAPGGDELADPSVVAAGLAAALPADAGQPVWVGWSLGGLVALAAARRAECAHGCVLITANPRFVRDTHWEAALDPHELEAFADLLAHDPARLRRQFAALCARGAENPGELARTLRARLEAAAARPAALAAGLAALRDVDRRADLDAVAPLAALLAADDALVPVAVERELAARAPAARVARVPGPHALPLAAPDVVAEFIHATVAEAPA